MQPLVLDNHDETSVMPVQRCAQLIISAIQGYPSILFHESWIAKQPTLTFLYLNQYFPTLATWILSYVGKWRTKAWEMGLPLYKVSSWLQAAKADMNSNIHRDVTKVNNHRDHVVPSDNQSTRDN
jgi:hypothetical protein